MRLGRGKLRQADAETGAGTEFAAETQRVLRSGGSDVRVDYAIQTKHRIILYI